MSLLVGENGKWVEPGSTVYCTRTVEPFLDSKKPEAVALARPLACHVGTQIVLRVKYRIGSAF